MDLNKICVGNIIVHIFSINRIIQTLNLKYFLCVPKNCEIRQGVPRNMTIGGKSKMSSSIIS